MLQMGGDFGFENANAWFKNLDALIEAVGRQGRVNVRRRDPSHLRSCVSVLTVDDRKHFYEGGGGGLVRLFTIMNFQMRGRCGFVSRRTVH